MTIPANAFVPFTRSLWDNNLDDPFRILEQTPLPLPRTHLDGLDGPGLSGLALARADWKETQTAHEITLDVPGMRKEDVKIEVEENRVVRVSGERKAAEETAESGGEKWHRAERTHGKFWRQFRMPMNADLDRVKANLEDGVLRITVPKVAEERRRQPKVVDIAVEKEGASGGEDVKATTKANM